MRSQSLLSYTKNICDLVQFIIWYQQSYDVKPVCTSYSHYLDKETRNVLKMARIFPERVEEEA